MKILSAAEIRQADAYTIKHEPVSSIDLMERAASACFHWINHRFKKTESFKIFCGTGNNGGDGLALARMMLQAKYNVEVYIIYSSDYRSADFNENERRLIALDSKLIKSIYQNEDIPVLEKSCVVIDAIFGTGLNRPLDGIASICIRSINKSLAQVIAIDIPSGLFADVPVDQNVPVIKAAYTLSFHVPKLAFMFAENNPYVGEWTVLDIGLDEKFISSLPSKKFLINRELAGSFLKPRKKYSHKGLFGHALLIAGSEGKIGAAVLAAGACLRSGVGLLTVHVPGCGYEVIQISVPEAMAEKDEDERILTSKINTDKFSAVGIGSGIGTENKSLASFKHLLTTSKAPVVLDADAINMLGIEKELMALLPENTVLTPHQKEFERITQMAKNDFHRFEMQTAFSEAHKVFVILKGAHTCIACPDGSVYFNTTGNKGMAKGGSGDALTGIILSFLAQNYSPKEASILGVYIHGLAGDIAAKKFGIESMLPTDLIENLGLAFKEIEGLDSR